MDICGSVSTNTKGAVLYDYLFCRGGAERVALTLAQDIPNTVLCAGFRNSNAFSNRYLSKVSYIDLHAQTRIPGWRLIKGARAFQTKTDFLSDYDWVIYSGAIAPLAVHKHTDGCNIYYCHTTPRFIYDLRDFYVKRMAGWQRPGLEAIGWYLRKRYHEAIGEMDTIIANSVNVQNRIAKDLGYESVVVNPPCDVDKFRWEGQEGYYLSTGRLESYKRVERIVLAFLKLTDKRVVIASGGSEFDRLRRLAAGAKNIKFLGWVDDRKMRDLIGHCIATIYIPQDEDFGISPVESMAAGKPVIGVAEGGLLETVIDGETGILLGSDPSPEEIIGAVTCMKPGYALGMRVACEQRAEHFRRDIFIDRMRSIIGQG